MVTSGHCNTSTATLLSSCYRVKPYETSYKDVLIKNIERNTGGSHGRGFNSARTVTVVYLTQLSVAYTL